MRNNKHLASFLILIIMFIGAALPTKRAQAFLGIGDFGVTVDIVQEAIKLTMNTAAHTFQRLIVQQLVQSTVTWANSGFEGNPQYHVNLQQDITNAANNSATAFITALGQNPNLLCSPFQNNITISLKNYYTPTTAFQCTFSGIAANLTNFYNSFSNGGGWNTWFNVTQVAADNPYQVYANATQQIDTRVSASVNILNQKTQINSGFLDVSPCIANNPDQATMNRINKWRSGADVTDINSPDYDPAVGLYWAFDENNPDDYASLKSDQAAGKILYNAALAAGACIAHGDVETPGTVIKDQINGTVAAPLNQLVNAQDWDEVVSALVAGLTKRIFTSATGLFNGQSGNSPTAGLPTGNEPPGVSYTGPTSGGNGTTTPTGGGTGGSAGPDLSCSPQLISNPLSIGISPAPAGEVLVLWNINTSPSGATYEYEWSGDDIASSTVYDSNGAETGTSYDPALGYATSTIGDIGLIVTYDTADASVNSGFKNMYLTASSTSTTGAQTIHALDGPVSCQPFNLANPNNPAT